MPVYCEEQVEERIRKSFDYAFTPEDQNYGGGVPQIAFRRITHRAVRGARAADRAAAAASTAGFGCWAFASATWPIAPTPTKFRRKAGRC